MPKIIKSEDEKKYFSQSNPGNSKKEENKYFFGQLSSDQNAGNESKYFFQSNTKPNKEDEIKKLFNLPSKKKESIKELEDKIATIYDKKDEIVPVAPEKNTSVVEDEDDDFITLRDKKAQQREEKRMFLQAEEEAKGLVDAAQAKAEAIRSQLATEMSEAEEKRRLLSKTIVEDTVAQANSKAQNIVEEAIKKSDEILKNAAKKGYEKGYAEGHTKGLEVGTEDGKKMGFEKGRLEGIDKINSELAQKVSDATQQAKDIIVSAETERDEIINSSDEHMVSIVMAVASKVINQNVEENPFTVLQIVKEAAKKVCDQPKIFVNVSPANFELVSSAQNELKKLLGGKQDIMVVADNSFGPADVVIGTSGNGDVDARLETQLAEIRKTIESVINQ